MLRIRIRIILESWIRIRIKYVGKLDPHPHQSKKQDPDPHQSDKVEALEGHFEALRGSKSGKKVSGSIRICIKLKDRIWIRIRVKGMIRIRIKAMRICNTACQPSISLFHFSIIIPFPALLSHFSTKKEISSLFVHMTFRIEYFLPRDFPLQVFFKNQFPPSPSVSNFPKIWGDIRSSRCTTGIVDTGRCACKFATGVVDNSGVDTMTCEYLQEFSKKFEMILMLFSGAWGKMIHEKNLQQKISWHCPFKKHCSWKYRTMSPVRKRP